MTWRHFSLKNNRMVVNRYYVDCSESAIRANLNHLTASHISADNKNEIVRQCVPDAAVCAAREFIKEKRHNFQRAVAVLKYQLTHNPETGNVCDYYASRCLPQVSAFLNNIQSWTAKLRACKTIWLYSDLSTVRCSAAMVKTKWDIYDHCFTGLERGSFGVLYKNVRA